MELLLTGAGGFSGRYLCRYLAERGANVHAVVRRSQAIEPADPYACDRVNLICSDLRETSSFPSRIDAVVHTAATSPADGVTTEMMMLDNVVAMHSLVRYALQARARLFVMFSSVSIYGEVHQPVLDEATPVRNPDVYGMTKLLGEKILEQHAGDLPSVVLRLPGILGPGSRRNWLSVLKQKLRADQPVAFFNPDSEFNNAVHVADLAELVAGQLHRAHTGCLPAVLGAEGHMTVRDAVELLRAECASLSPIRMDESPRPSFLIDSRRARDELGYRPMRIDDMLRRFAAEDREPGHGAETGA